MTDALVSELREGKARPVYLFYGETGQFYDRYLSLFKKHLLGSAGELNYRVFEFKEHTAQEVIGSCCQVPFGDGKRLVLGIGTGGEIKASGLEHLVDYCSAPQRTSCLVFLVYGPVKDIDSLVKAVREQGKVLELGALRKKGLSGLIRTEVKKLGLKMDKEALEYLSSICGDEMHARNELYKLWLYSGGTVPVTKQTVMSVCSPDTEVTIFELLDAIGEQPVDVALRCFRQLLRAGEPPVRIVYMLSRHMCLLLRAKLLADAGCSPKEVADELQIKEFVAERLVRKAPRFSVHRLKENLERLLELDTELKSTSWVPDLKIELAILGLGNNAGK